MAASQRMVDPGGSGVAMPSVLSRIARHGHRRRHARVAVTTVAQQASVQALLERGALDEAVQRADSERAIPSRRISRRRPREDGQQRRRARQVRAASAKATRPTGRRSANRATRWSAATSTAPAPPPPARCRPTATIRTRTIRPARRQPPEPISGRRRVVLAAPPSSSPTSPTRTTTPGSRSQRIKQMATDVRAPRAFLRSRPKAPGTRGPSTASCARSVLTADEQEQRTRTKNGTERRTERTTTRLNENVRDSKSSDRPSVDEESRIGLRRCAPRLTAARSAFGHC